MFPAPRFVQSNGIEMAVHEQGQGAPIVLVHGFLELAFSWRHQLPALAAAGYRAIAPDMRGCGRTDKPDGVESYTIQQLVADLTGLLDALEIEQATVAAHDWGALLAWQLALLAPERVSRLVALNIPFFPRPPVDPIELLRAARGNDYYIVNFQDSDEADRRCADDPARVFDVMMRRNVVTRERFNLLPREVQNFSLLAALRRENLSGEEILSAEEKRVYVDAYAAGGFTAPINWYRNWSHNWATTADVEQQVTVPTLFIGAVDDVIISLQQIEAMKPFVSNLEIHMLDNCGHWTQQERPDAVNTLLIDWLARH